MIKCAIVGASGLVGNMFLKVLEEKKLKIDEYVLFASYRSKGKKIKFNNKKYVIQELKEDSFNNKNFNYALFSAGSEVSKKYIPIAVKNNITVIDNSSYFRMNKNIPLVVPEININECKNNKIISNPNCSTIQEVLPLYVLNNKYKIKRVIFTTFQAVSGSGIKGINDLINTRKEKKFTKFQYNITNNCIPHIDEFTDNDYTKEEIKMID
ncbi:MAG: aspartate-semialdehyde dehydrogenase, partial [Clostridia bacterium]